MKRSVRPLFSILLLVVFALTLSCRILIPRGDGVGFIGFEKPKLILQKKVPVFNSTLLKYSAIDIGEEQAKHEIEELLEGNFDSRGRYWLDFRRALHDWARKKRYQPEIMDELIGLLKGPIDRHNGLVGSERRYGSCAVVGNSGILMQKEHGELIDRHEVVIRLNNARTERYERNVGAKTNISFVNSNILHLCGRRQGCFCHPYGANVPMVMYICQPAHFLDYTVCNSSHDAPLIVTDPRFDLLCARIVKYYSLKRFVEETGKSLDEWGSAHDGSMFHYSSGMQAVMLAVGICDKVSIFGFGKSALARHHYHTNQKAELKLHDYEAEYDLYHDLVNNPQAVPFITDKFKFPATVIYQ
ncbi:hypothetical protein NC652_011802 [Populus alba x Populus x berolinensis]|nr:hypothetical protein NC652_011802 [Populus alba x Populus x berolinensis]